MAITASIFIFIAINLLVSIFIFIAINLLLSIFIFIAIVVVGSSGNLLIFSIFIFIGINLLASSILRVSDILSPNLGPRWSMAITASITASKIMNTSNTHSSILRVIAEIAFASKTTCRIVDFDVDVDATVNVASFMLTFSFTLQLFQGVVVVVAVERFR